MFQSWRQLSLLWWPLLSGLWWSAPAVAAQSSWLSEIEQISDRVWNWKKTPEASARQRSRRSSPPSREGHQLIRAEWKCSRSSSRECSECSREASAVAWAKFRRENWMKQKNSRHMEMDLYAFHIFAVAHCCDPLILAIDIRVFLIVRLTNHSWQKQKCVQYCNSYCFHRFKLFPWLRNFQSSALALISIRTE